MISGGNKKGGQLSKVQYTAMQLLYELTNNRDYGAIKPPGANIIPNLSLVVPGTL